MANQSAVTQILRILLDNAIKYSPEHSTVTMSVATSHGFTISVADEGVGIAPEHHTNVFDRFFRVDESRSSRHAEGSGLGLSIAKSIADRHGYDLALTSKVGKGSTFSLTIPA